LAKASDHELDLQFHMLADLLPGLPVGAGNFDRGHGSCRHAPILICTS
jgi:hypothetical protein